MLGAELDRILAELLRQGLLVAVAPSPAAAPAAAVASPIAAAPPSPTVVTAPGAWLLAWEPASGVPPQVRSLHPDCELPLAVHTDRAGCRVHLAGCLFDDAHVRPAKAVADARARWGDAFCDQLRGAFVAMLWEERPRRLLVVRDATGLMPCFYFWNGQVLVLSSSIQAVLSHPAVDKRLSRALLAEYVEQLSCSLQAEETFFSGIVRLLPAHRLQLQDGKLSTQRYWDPLPPGFAWATPGEIASLETVLQQAVTRWLGAGADCIALSGGYDSIALAALASQVEGQPPLSALSLRFAHTPCDEGVTQREVARLCGMTQTLMDASELLTRDDAVARALAPSRAAPSPVLSVFQWMYDMLLEGAQARGLSGMLMGTGGDEMFIVDPAFAGDLLRQGQLFELTRFVRAWQRTSPFTGPRVAKHILWHATLRPWLRRAAIAALDRTSPAAKRWLRDRPWSRDRGGRPAPLTPHGSLRAELAERQLLSQASERSGKPSSHPNSHRAYLRAMRHLPQAPLLMLELDQAHAWAASHAMTLCYPFFDRDVVQLALRIPPPALYAEGLMKAPLRKLVSQKLPGLRLPQRKVDFSLLVGRMLRHSGRQQWASAGGASALADLGVVDGGRADHAVTQALSDDTPNWARAWNLLSAEAWARQHA